jgi:hypothetical protein
VAGLTLREYVGAVHLHTVHSDGTATHTEVAYLAEKAGLDFVIVTDHNVREPEVEGYHRNLLLLVGEEIHDPQRVPQSSHLLVFGTNRSFVDQAAEPQSLIDTVREAGGLAFLAHPFERSATYSGEPDINWRDWDVTGYTGLEIWNTMSEFKSLVPTLPRALLMAYFPDLGLRGPLRETLARWDELLAMGRRVAIIGGPDAHGTMYKKGPLVRPVLAYDWLLQAVRLHILTAAPFTGDVEHDAALLYEALRQGRSFVAYDRIGDATGFRFCAQTGGASAGMGQSIAFEDRGVRLIVTTPVRAYLRLIRQGQVVAEARSASSLQYDVAAPGAYRVEAYLRHRLRLRGWVFTNPIYVQSG